MVELVHRPVSLGAIDRLEFFLATIAGLAININ